MIVLVVGTGPADGAGSATSTARSQGTVLPVPSQRSRRALPGPAVGSVATARDHDIASGTVPSVLSRPADPSAQTRPPSAVDERSDGRADGRGTDAASDVRAGTRSSTERLRSWLLALVREHLGSSLKFLAVGGIVFFLDAAMYNALVFWSPGEGWGHGIMHGHPLVAKTISIAIASCLTYLGNRLWTFSDRPAPDTGRSISAFILVNIIATLLQLACLGFSRYVLGLDSPLADNISGTLIGQIVSTSFRYVTYGRFVFPRER